MNISTTIHKGLFSLKKHSPEILVVSGVIGVVASTIMACKATMNVCSILEQHKQSLENIHQKYQNLHSEEQEKTEKDEQKELVATYVRTGLDFTRLYTPSVVIGVFSIAGILTSNNILRKRNLALAAAYTVVDKRFKDYSRRVAERFGEETERELRCGIHAGTIEESVIDENGEEQKNKKDALIIEDDGPSDFARFFAYGEAKAAEPNADYNEFFLKAQQEVANQKLKAYGFLFLNDVYDMLGIERSIPGQVVGWVYDKNSEDRGDNYVDFGITEVARKRDDDPNSFETVFFLDFNVDGMILDRAFNKGLITK